MAIFGPKPWIIDFGKISIFRLFELLVFIAQKGVFFFLEYRKRHFFSLYLLKKKFEKWLFLDQNHGLTPLEKCQFFDCLIFFFFGLDRRFFVLEYRKTHFPGLYCLKRKLEKWPFSDQNPGLTLLEKCQFFVFLKFLFLQPRKAFSRSRIS